MNKRALELCLVSVLLAGCGGMAAPTPDAPRAAGPAYTSSAEEGRWLRYASPAEAGFSAAALDSVRRYADSVQSGAVVAVYRGHVIAAWGDVARELELHSVRKSLVSGLYGTAVARGAVDLDATLAELGIDDATPLTSTEKGARVRDLLAARSGVYLGAAYAPSDQDEERPDRGAHDPGSHWFYNNWDFNVAGVIYERETGEDLYHSFAARIARPLGMEDWRPEDGTRIWEPSQSDHPAHTIRMSARDLARFGQLYLQEGRWAGERVVPADWVAGSTRPVSDFGDGRGYAFMWWTYAPGSLTADRYAPLAPYRIYAGSGTGGQLVAVVPELELVVVHRGDTDNSRPISGRDAWTIVAGIAGAKRGPPEPDPELAPMSPVAFESQAPPYDWPAVIALPATVLADYYGEYALAPGAVIRIFEWEGRPFVFMPGEGEAELFAIGRDAFTVRVVPGVHIRFERDAAGNVVGLRGSLGPQRFEAPRVP